MTRALGEYGPGIEAGLRKLALEMQIQAVLELAADLAHERYGARRLIVDRAKDADTVDVKAVIGDSGLVDLWDLDPLLWDDANWAAMRLVPSGHIRVVGPPRRD